MADMSVALRVFAETGEAQAGLRQLAEALRAMGVGQREAATLAATAGREAAQSWGEVAAPTRASAEVIDLLGLHARGAGAASSAAAREAENAWIASALGMTGAMTAVGTALEAGMPDLSGWLSQQAAGLAETARESAEAAAATAEFRAMLHPLAATAKAAADGLEQVAIAEEMGALTAQEASVLIDRLNRSLIETARVADAAGLPLDGLGPSGRAAATGLQQLIEAQTGVAASSPIAALLQHGQALDDLRARFSPVYAEARRLVTEIAAVEDAERQGAISAREASLALEGLETALAGVRAQAAQTGVSLEALGLPARTAATDMQRLIEAQTGLTRASEGSIAAQLQHGQMLDDLRARFSPLFAATRQYEQELRDIAEAERLTAITAGEAAEARDRVAAAYGRATGATGPLAGGIARVGQASGAAAAYTANLGYQVNDIAMMMAAGQNPFMLMMQQGTQVTQVFQDMQRAGVGIGASIRTALMGMVSPLSLMTMGVIGGGALLVQWLTDTGDEADKTVEKVKTFAEKVDEATGALQRAGRAARTLGSGGLAQLREDYGGVTLAVVELAQELAGRERRAALVKLELVFDDALAANFAAQLERAMGSVGSALSGAYSAETEAIAAEIDELAADIANRQALGVFVSPGELERLRSMREELAAVRGDIAGIGSLAEQVDVDPALITRLAEARSLLASSREAADFAGMASAMREIHRVLTESGQVLDQDVLDRLVIAEDLARRAALELGRVARAAALTEDRATRETRVREGVGPATRASIDERADLDRQAAMAALIVQHGRNSLVVAQARVEEERRLYELQLSGEAISGPERQRRLEAWDLARGMVAVERDRLSQLQMRLDEARQEAQIAALVATHGADSAVVARARAQAERDAREALIQSTYPAGTLRDQLIAAERAGDALAQLDIAAGIEAAASGARALARELGVSLATAQVIAGMGLGEAALAAGDERGSQRGVRSDAARANSARILAAQAKARKVATGKGGGGEARDTLAGLTKEATEVLAALDLAAAGVAEKVRAGLMSVAEGETAMAQAKERAAGQLAELIARLERLGPAGKVAADAARGALRDLAAEAGKTDRTIREGMVKSFEDSFVRSLATGKDAFSSFADHIQTELARAFTQKFVTPMMSPLIDGIMGMFSGLFSARGNVIAAGHLVPYALGGVPDSALPGLPPLGTHRDSVVDRPTAFPMAGNQIGVMGEAGAEAILPMLMGHAGQGVRGLAPDGSTTVLPLRRAPGGALGVQLPQAPDVGAILRRPSFFAEGGVIGRLSDPPRVGEQPAGSGFAATKGINVNIHNNNPTAKVTATERPGGDGMSIDVVIDQIEANIADRTRRGVGPLAAVLGDSFGARRVGR